MYKICVFIPLESAEVVKTAMFDAGAGRIGNYEHCSFETQGLGQFRPLPGSQPFIGKTLELEYVAELKVEMVCEDKFIKDVVTAMKKTHPYETPAFDIIKLDIFE